MSSIISDIINFKGTQVIVSSHAETRFVERWKRLNQSSRPPQKPLRTLSKLLNDATLEDIGPIARVRRLINNNFTDAEYWSNHPWRFVIVREEAEIKLVTVEIKWQ